MMEQPQEIRFKGLGVSQGVVIGQVPANARGNQHVYHWRINDADLEAEHERFRAAVRLASEQVLKIKNS